MYHSSLKGKNDQMTFKNKIEIPHKVFFNDMSKTYLVDDFLTVDCIYSEISWSYGFNIFNRNAQNDSLGYTDYLKNIAKLARESKKPTFIFGGKGMLKYFNDASVIKPFQLMHGAKSISGGMLYVWNYDPALLDGIGNTNELIDFLAQNFNKCLDFSCGYGEHLLKFKDFIGCDIDRDCLTYLAILYEGKKKNE